MSTPEHGMCATDPSPSAMRQRRAALKYANISPCQKTSWRIRLSYCNGQSTPSMQPNNPGDGQPLASMSRSSAAILETALRLNRQVTIDAATPHDRLREHGKSSPDRDRAGSP